MSINRSASSRIFAITPVGNVGLLKQKSPNPWVEGLWPRYICLAARWAKYVALWLYSNPVDNPVSIAYLCI